MINRRNLVLAGSTLAALFATQGISQTTGKGPRRVAIVSPYSAQSTVNIDALRAALKSLGYAEGRDLIIDMRFAENRLERLPALVEELLALKPDVIVTTDSPGVVACQKATSVVPIVFASAGDPVGQGFIKSYHHPGGNITGIAFPEEINKKQYEIVKMMLPSATRIATLVNIKNPAQKHHIEDVPVMSKALGFVSILVHATKEEELEAAFQDAVKARAHAMVVGTLAPFGGLRVRLVELQNKYKLPAFTGTTSWVPGGGLASYSPLTLESWRRTAALVDKVLKGENPANIPVEIPTRYEMAVNLKTAKMMGITVPKEILVRADKVIE